MSTKRGQLQSLLMQEHRPHLVLLDLVLPGVDGIGLMRELFQKGRVPVIFVSAYGRDEVMARAFDAGASDYVVKPFSPTEPSVFGKLTVDYGPKKGDLGRTAGTVDGHGVPAAGGAFDSIRERR